MNRPGTAKDGPGATTPTTLKRSPADRWLMGVCGGFARHFGVPAWLVRLLWAVSVPVTLGLSVIAYVVLTLLLREDSAAGDGAP